MGCAPSKPPVDLHANEVYRKEVPRRVVYPTGKVGDGWVAATVGKQHEGENIFSLRVDNGGPMMKVMLKRPATMVSFEDFSEYNEDNGGTLNAEEDYDMFARRLPIKPGQNIEVILGAERRWTSGFVASVPQYGNGTKLMVLASADNAFDAEVLDQCNSGSLHKVQDLTSKPPRELKVDLNEFNHAHQRFDSVAQYNAQRKTYLGGLITQLAMIEDAITGNKLNVDDQLIYITVVNEKPGAKSDWSDVSNMEGLTDHMLAPAPNRAQGTYGAQGVLLRAGPGTGKTVSLQQLTRLMAKQLHATADSENGIGLVPMLISVQRLASYMKKGVLKDSTDLLRSYIEVEYSDDIKMRDMLLQAMELRAIICAIDGVDEAAGLKTRIEDMIVDKLEPMGIRVVASSRPEGVRVERYSKFLVMNLSPLSEEQQQRAIAFQLKESKEYDHFTALSKARKAVCSNLQENPTAADLNAELKKAAGAQYDAVTAHILASTPKDTDVLSELVRVLDFFDIASAVPVMLSMLVLCFEDIASGSTTAKFPKSRLNLYTTAVRSAIRRRFPGDTSSQASIESILARVAAANHLAQRREFTMDDVDQVLAADGADVALWHALENEPAGVPLVKVLEVGVVASKSGDSDTTSKYQFKHLSFQEAFFAEGLCGLPEAAPAIIEQSQSVWKRGALKVLNDRWMLNTFAICGPMLGRAVSEHLGKGLTELRLTEHQVKVMVALEWQPLRGQSSLKTLCLQCGFGIDFHTKASPGVTEFAALLGDKAELPSLTKLDFGLPARIGFEAASLISNSVSARKHLRLCGSLHFSQFTGLSAADAVLIATSLRNCGGNALDIATVSGATLRTSGEGDVPILCTSNNASDTLAAAFKAANLSPSAFPKDLGSHLMLAGFSAADLKAARYSTAELIEVGFSAQQLLVAMSDGPPSAAVLKELGENGLTLELAAGPSRVSLDELRKAGCPGVPSDEDMDEALSKTANAKTKDKIPELSTFGVSREELSDADGAFILWAVALHCKSNLSELNLSQNSFGQKTAAVLGQILRFNKSIKMIDLHQNSLEDAGAALIAKALHANSSLTSLRLSTNGVTKNGAPAILNGLVANLKLATIVLETAAGADTTGIPIPQLKGLVANELIDLSSKRFGPISVYIIGQLIQAYRPQLVELGLDRNPVTGEGVAFLAEFLKNNDDIKELDLRFCAMKVQGAVALANALRVNTSIEKLLILQNQIGDEGAEAMISMLPHNASLRMIGLQDNLLSPAMKEKVKEAAQQRGNIIIHV